MVEIGHTRNQNLFDHAADYRNSDCHNKLFPGSGKGFQELIFLSLTRQVLFLIPLVLILPAFFKLDGIWMAGPIADFSSAMLAILLLVKEFRYLQIKHDQIDDII